ncbi:hypothetical protein J572_4268 [Acinetobacter baumannii 1499986]|uniref:Uncharacterized protein n=1 Tax=Acinetobacter baumannii 1499986 TaxID=1310673 RepID=A0A836YL08_ACIBA|nr:hypothetical protein [Acinetobacter baumannii]KCX93032.1 hypothetical protein J572_4268 [Acinetobacter baumannii 1499986]
MSLKEKLGELEDALLTLAHCAPDDYNEWRLEYFPTQEAIHEEEIKDLRALWSEIRPKIKKDLVKADYVGVKLQEMMDAFDKGDKDEGKKIAGELADLYDITKLK